jgi:hypothetical protein
VLDLQEDGRITSFLSVSEVGVVMIIMLCPLWLDKLYNTGDRLITDEGCKVMEIAPMDHDWFG